MSKPELQLVKNDEKKPKEEKAPTADEGADDSTDADADDEGGKTPRVDPVRAETLNILSDLIELSRTPKTASATSPK